MRGDAHIRGNLELELNDPNGDGRVRFQELFDNFSYNPLAIFDASVQVALAASIGVELGWDPFSTSFTIYETPEFELFSVDIPGGAPPQPYYASAPDDATVLLLNVGPRAEERNIDPNDGAESMTLRMDGDAVVIEGPGAQSEQFNGIQQIKGDSGDGDDVIDAMR